MITGGSSPISSLVPDLQSAQGTAPSPRQSGSLVLVLPCAKPVSTTTPRQTTRFPTPGNRPIGARDAAQNTQTCLGPSGTCASVQPHTGHNTHDSKQASSRLPRQEDQRTRQPAASSSGRSPTAEDRASPATAALQPHKPPYFCGGADDDVHVWTSIVSHWLDTVQGEPSTQLTYIVSLLEMCLQQRLQRLLVLKRNTSEITTTA